MAKHRKPVEAVAYLRTSSATNAGPDKDSDKPYLVAAIALMLSATASIKARNSDCGRAPARRVEPPDLRSVQQAR
jgi:hypothetical protein